MPEQWNKYDLTAARPHGRPGRELRPKSVTIDVHAHVGVPEAAKFVEPHLDWATIPLANFATPETKALGAKQEADIRGRAGIAQRLADLDAMGVDMQLIAPPPPQCYYTVPLDIAVKATRLVNDGVAAFCAQKADRFKPLCSVPMTDAGEAVKELERCIKTLGFAGVEILTTIAGKELSDPAFAPFWKKAEELGTLVMIHPNGFTEASRLSRFYFNNVIGNPLETTIALHYLIFDGVLERHPKLKILAVHGGGYLGAYPGRIDRAARRALRQPRHAAAAADELSQARLRRYRRIHALSARRTRARIWRRPRPDGHRLSLRHGRVRSGRPHRRRRGLRCRDHRRACRRQCEAAAGPVGYARPIACHNPNLYACLNSSGSSGKTRPGKNTRMARRRIVEEPMSRLAVWSLRVALFSLVATLIAVIIVRSGALEIVPAVSTLGGALLMAVVAILLALAAGVGIWVEGYGGLRQAVAAVLIGLVLIAYPTYLGVRAYQLPAIYDVTTDPIDPPQFAAIARLRPREANPIAYQGLYAAELQHAAYSDVEPEETTATPQEAFNAAMKVITKLALARG